MMRNQMRNLLSNRLRKKLAAADPHFCNSYGPREHLEEAVVEARLHRWLGISAIGN